MRIVRASEISQFLYCQRAWWYAVVEQEPISPLQTESGRIYHHSKHFLLVISRLFRGIAFLLIVAGIGLLLLRIL